MVEPTKVKSFFAQAVAHLGLRWHLGSCLELILHRLAVDVIPEKFRKPIQAPVEVLLHRAGLAHDGGGGKL